LNAVILVGGLGTRLGNLTKETPKPLLPIRGKPFLLSLLEHLFIKGFSDVVLATGYKHDVVEEFIKNLSKKHDIPNIIFSKEDKALGTGGAIMQAINYINSDFAFIFNGDTFIDINYDQFLEFHMKKKSNISICANFIKEGTRYGSLKFDQSFRLLKMDNEAVKNSHINAGNYLINIPFIKKLKKLLPSNAFSFEDVILKNMSKSIHISCFTSSKFFMDIGVPEDYKIAQEILFNE
jgi:D-glycero-alpha-D-manno-heptose 1-phosphate guanylyltransferase|tara:strand:+ start:2343 stop:3050 length:708 start_codon:yes stop_codon:yes gene_type:complete